MMRYLRFAIGNSLIMLAVLFLVGCGSEADYDVVIRNASERTVRDAHVVFNGFRSIGGVLVPNGEAVDMNLSAPVPDSAIIEWRSFDGVLHRETIDMKDLVPEGFASGLLVFEISNGGVRFKIEPRFRFIN